MGKPGAGRFEVVTRHNPAPLASVSMKSPQRVLRKAAGPAGRPRRGLDVVVSRKGREVQKQRRAFLVGVSKGDEISLVQRKAWGFERG